MTFDPLRFARAARRRPLRLAALASLGAAVAVAAGSAAAVLRSADLQLRHGGTTCDGKGTYRYTATWQGGANASYHVQTGNQCALGGGTVCGISGTGCVATCSRTGACRAELRLCVVGKGAPWSRVVAADRSAMQQITTAAPGKCQ